MASDSLNQVGKYINQTGKNANRALKRARPIQPRLERVRDIFDDTTPFEMGFVKEDNDERVLLDLFFNLPPPIRGCKAGCIHSKCEEFDFPNGGNHYVTVQHPYLANSVSVYVNGDKLPDSDVDGNSGSGAGEVFFQSNSSGPDTIAVCYIYEDADCSQSNSLLCAKWPKPSFFGGTLAFSDRFDRTPSIETWGGLGYWYQMSPPPFDSGISGPSDPNANEYLAARDISNLQTPVAISPIASGYSQGGTYVFEEIRAGGPTSEQIVLVDFTFSNSFALIAPSLHAIQPNWTNGSFGSYVDQPVPYPFVSINTDGVVTMNVPYHRVNAAALFSPLWMTQTLNAGINMRQKLFIKFMVALNTWQVKIWPMNEPEPTTWLQFTAPLPTFDRFNPNTPFQYAWSNPLIAGGYISASALLGVEHWVGQIGGQSGTWDHQGSTGKSWTRSVGHTYAGFYWDPDVESDDYGEFSTLAHGSAFLNSDIPAYTMVDIAPECSVTIGWSSFDVCGDHKPIAVYNKTASWDTTIGKETSVRITGELSWSRVREASNNPPLSIELMAFNYGENGPPPTLGDYFWGTTVQTVVPEMDQWVPFDITIPTTATGQAQWGVRFSKTPTEIGDGFACYAGNFFFESTVSASIAFRNLYIEASGSPIGGAKPICPDTGLLADRCAQFYDNPVQPTIEAGCGDNGIDSFTWQATSGQIWGANLPQGYGNFLTNANLVLNNSIRLEFKPRGITADGSDGKCPYDFSNALFAGPYSQTDASVTLIVLAPSVCGAASFSTQFKFGNLTTSYIITGAGPTGNTNRIGTEQNADVQLNFGLNSGDLFLQIDEFQGKNIRLNSRNGPVILGNLQPETVYNLLEEVTSTGQRVKVWQQGYPEPSSWNYSVTNYSVGFSNALWITGDVVSFIDDDFYIEFFNPVVSSIDEGAF